MVKDSENLDVRNHTEVARRLQARKVLCLSFQYVLRFWSGSYQCLLQACGCLFLFP